MVHWSFHLTPERTLLVRSSWRTQLRWRDGASKRRNFVKRPLRLVRNYCGAISCLRDAVSRAYIKFHRASTVVPSERDATLRQGFEFSAASAPRSLTHRTRLCLMRRSYDESRATLSDFHWNFRTCLLPPKGNPSNSTTAQPLQIR